MVREGRISIRLGDELLTPMEEDNVTGEMVAAAEQTFGDSCGIPAIDQTTSINTSVTATLRSSTSV